MDYLKSKVIGNERQLTVGIPKKFWKIFTAGERIEIRTLDGDYIVRKIRAIGNGRQWIVTIPREDWDIFIKGDKVLLYKVSKYQKKPTTNQQKNEQMDSEIQMPESELQ